ALLAGVALLSAVLDRSFGREGPVAPVPDPTPPLCLAIGAGFAAMLGFRAVHALTIDPFPRSSAGDDLSVGNLVLLGVIRVVASLATYVAAHWVGHTVLA